MDNSKLIAELTKIKNNLEELTSKKEELTNELLETCSNMFLNSVWKDYDNNVVFGYLFFPDKASTYFVSFSITLLKYIDKNLSNIEQVVITPSLNLVNLPVEKVIKEVTSEVNNKKIINDETCFAKGYLEDDSVFNFTEKCSRYFTDNLDTLFKMNGLSDYYSKNNIIEISDKFKKAHDEFQNALKLPNATEALEYWKTIQSGHISRESFIKDIEQKNNIHLKLKLEKDLCKNLEKYKKQSKV